jgi:hypothetical protein
MKNDTQTGAGSTASHTASDESPRPGSSGGGSNPLDEQIGGGHYKDMAIQPVEFCHKNGIGFLEGNIIKYVCRHHAKSGKQDLEKAAHYLRLLMRLEYGD